MDLFLVIRTNAGRSSVDLCRTLGAYPPLQEQAHLSASDNTKEDYGSMEHKWQQQQIPEGFDLLFSAFEVRQQNRLWLQTFDKVI